ncbi:HAD-IIIC family phosphatase [Tistrella mobilis]|uniref:HAD-IIIC family phosphatase n=1 Tax=Tistrella mobilis TaxID=171437 RepID=UPI0031F61ACD
MTDIPIDQLPWLPVLTDRLRDRARAVADLAADDRMAGLQGLRHLAGHRLDLAQAGPVAKLADRVIGEAGGAPLFRTVRLCILSDTTTALLPPVLRVAGLRHGLDLQITTTPDDQIMSVLNDPAGPLTAQPVDLVLLALDRRRLPHWPAAGSGDDDAAMAAVGDHIAQIARRISATTGATLIFQTLPQEPIALFGHLERRMAASLRRQIDRVNHLIQDQAAALEALLLDVDALAGQVGTARWHDPRHWHWSKSAVAPAMLPLYADHLARLIAAWAGLARRCLVLDLDNTLWGGVIGDDGPDGIILGQGDAEGEAFLAVQRLALDLRRRGIVLAVASKNDAATARLPFRDHPDMLLGDDDVAVFIADWRDKASQLEEIARRLGWGLDALVLLDDNPAERRQVRDALPQVAVPELPADPAGMPLALMAGGWFETVTVSAEDRLRADHYTRQARAAADNPDTPPAPARREDFEAYLRGLEMRLTLAPIDARSRPRAAQLIGRSNQFNLTTRRIDAAGLAAIEADPARHCFAIRLADVFGDAGIISVVIIREVAVPDGRPDGAIGRAGAIGQAGATERIWAIDLWLMSCRVLNRRVEQAVLKALAGRARARGIDRLIGLYLPSGRNALVAGHYARLGFTPCPAEAWPHAAPSPSDGSGIPALPEEATVWSLALAGYTPPELPIRIDETA